MLPITKELNRISCCASTITQVTTGSVPADSPLAYPGVVPSIQAEGAGIHPMVDGAVLYGRRQREDD